MKEHPSLIVYLPGEPVRRHFLPNGESTIGRAPQNSLQIIDVSVSGQHAKLWRKDSTCRVIDLGSSNGTKVNGRVVTASEISSGDELTFGAVKVLYQGGKKPLTEHLSYFLRERLAKERFLAVSLILHVLLILLLARLVLFASQERHTPFVGEGTNYLSDEKGDSEPEGAEGASPEESAPNQALELGRTSESMNERFVEAITSSLPTASSVAVNSRLFSKPVAPSASTKIGGGAGLGTGLGRSFGNASGLGKGIGDWIGAGGIGISGRGKTLKTVNEFHCYFVIHSGDWFAALDWRAAPEARQTEISYPDLPDSKKMNWHLSEPVAGMGPFLAYYYGNFPAPNRPNEREDSRNGCLEFTPGAMSNLLRFIRLASNNNIKGGTKPKAVVLDESLVPYRWNPSTQAITWNLEGREKLRETLRANLPGGGKFGAHGYLWNPQPLDQQQNDFLVEYLLDVKPMPPFIYFTGNNDFQLSEAELQTLNEYLRRGGAVWGDSGFAGNRSKFDVAFRREMKRVIPDEDKPFKVLAQNSPLFLRGEDAYFDLTNLPPGMQYYQSPIQVIEITPGVVSVVLTKNAYGNFLRYEMALVNNKFQTGGALGRGKWVNEMWEARDEFFRGLDDENILGAYSLASNILVYMLGRWPAVLNRHENR